MYDVVLLLHSWLRWAVLIVGLWAIYKNYAGWQSGNASFDPSVGRLNSIFIGSLHLQLIIGLALYFGLSPMMQAITADFKGSMKNPELRFWSVEHITGMILGIVVAQVGSIKSKKKATASERYKTAFTYFMIGLIVILMMIPFGIWNVERPLFRM